ncbi:hydroxyacid dehydrogenase [Geomicrobium sp. JCM 19039]|uniref:hydroxyacid dehydrogenase n=1 Tax=Geomicrobium sp. JCM 19039 TaxID=1460636 RepID=UPI00045F452B|nr:hydroxyacid dehydrogenase [Geomicrobium sp. JCM 19039]GAK13965.1 D-3-phosphoglycerate dehydrogenase [Geomicrobium sp. JCM 19039]
MYHKPSTDGIDYLERHGLEVTVLPQDTPAQVAKHIVSADGVLIRTTPLPKDILQKAPRLKVIARHGIGLDEIDQAYCVEKGIGVYNTPRANVNSVAEHVTAFILSLAHRIPEAVHALRRDDYASRNRLIGMEVAGKTLGLIGFGNIAQEVAKKCGTGLGMKIVAYDPQKETFPDGVEHVHTLDALARRSAFVSVHVPLLPTTSNMIDRTFFDAMQPASYFINAARGGIVDETALIEAITSGKLAGAALDCYAEEPMPVSFPLKGLDNVLLTPHMAAHTEDSMRAMAVGAAEAIVRELISEKGEDS